MMHHSLTWNPPYFRGYQDLWDNIFLGRLASHPWGGMRFMAAFIGGGDHGRYPSLRMGILECGSGWLPFWAKRMDEQAVYVGAWRPQACAQRVHDQRAVLLQHRASRGRGHVQLRPERLGDDVLMYASDYPHSECQFPDSMDDILKWSSLKPRSRKKLLWDNAAKFYKRT